MCWFGQRFRKISEDGVECGIILSLRKDVNLVVIDIEVLVIDSVSFDQLPTALNGLFAIGMS